MYQYFKRQLKTPTMFQILWDPSSGSIKRASLKLLVMFVCVVGVWQREIWTCGVCAWCDSLHQAYTPQVQISCCQTPTTHTNITSNFSEACLILPEDGSQRIRNMSEFLSFKILIHVDFNILSFVQLSAFVSQ